MRNIIALILLTISLNAFPQDAKPDRPPVIAITAIANFTRYLQESHDIMAIRDKVVSDLVRNYECVVISRSNGFALAAENALGKINVINRGETQAVDNITAADFAITGFFKTPNLEANWATYGCTLLIVDLSEKSKGDFRKTDFTPRENTNFSPDITAKIVEMLKLKPKKKVEPVNEVLNETWAILPVSHLESLKQMEQPADRSLSMSIELSLQESKKVKKIVDHNEIDKVLQELKISSLSGATESLAAGIAGIVGADRIVIGTVSNPTRPIKDGDNVRIDFLLVDGKKAVVLDSASEKCKKDELEQTAAKLVLQLTEQRHQTPELENASRETRKKESQLYLGMFDSIPSYVSWYDTASVDLGIAWAEAAYMLIPDDAAGIFEIAKTLYGRILCGYTSWEKFDPRTETSRRLSKPQIMKIVTAIDKFLQPESKFDKNQHALIIRADSYRLLGNYEKSLTLINKHISQYPDTEKDYAVCVLANIYYSKEDYQKVEEYLAEIRASKSWNKQGEAKLGKELGVKLYKKLGNEKSELEFLKKLGGLDWDAARTLELIRKLEGPTAVIEYQKKRPMYIFDTNRAEVQLEFAKTYLELGDKNKASLCLENANTESALSSMACFKNPAYKEKIKSEIDNLIKHVGPAKTEWKKAVEVNKIPDKFKMYVQPIGMTDLSVIQNAVPKLEEFWGCRVEILPTLPLPEDPLSFKKEVGRYNTELIYRVVRAIHTPKDSIYTEFITDKETFYDPNIAKLAAETEFRAKAKAKRKPVYLNSLYDYRNAGDIFKMSDAFSKTMTKGFAGRWRTHKRPTYENFTNRSNKSITFDEFFNDYFGAECDSFLCKGGDYKIFGICEICQKRLKNINYDEYYNYWKTDLDLGEPTDPEEKKWNDDYNVKVQEALKKADDEKIKKSHEKIDFLPSIEVADAKAGLSCDYYEFEKDKVKNLNQLAELQPQKSVTDSGFSIDSIERKENFGLVFSGFIKVPADDLYTFYLTSDDGSTLAINDSKIIDNDGMHAPETKTGTIALKAGFHPIRLAYIQGVGNRFLELYWRSEKHLIGQKIPGGVLFHK